MTARNTSLRRSIAVVIGINTYTNGVPILHSAVGDAMRLKEVLEQHHYHVELRVNEQATLTRLKGLFTTALPRALQEADRLLVYFAGHGVALNGDDGPAGYLLPQDAQSDDSASFLPMHQLHDWLAGLPCHHMLLILDCCFAGAFRWSSTRQMRTSREPLYRERYERFLASPAWQVITSAAYDQQALDFVTTYGKRDNDGRHSPFALALFAALGGAADRSAASANGAGGDGVITATELYSYLRDQVELGALDRGQQQTPGIWPLKNHRKGEYIFLVPGRKVELPAAPALTSKNNPYRGLEPFEEQHADLFFGRDEEITTLVSKIAAQPLTIVVGASGTGKSSLVKAGVLPRLRQTIEPVWQIIGPLRPGQRPQQALAGALPGGFPSLSESIAARRTVDPDTQILLVVDQFEELITLCRDDEEREQFVRQLASALTDHADRFHIVITIRADFEPQFGASALWPWWTQSRIVVTPLTQDELRAAILGPATVRVLYFDPDALVDRIINEVVQTPGALPLLSFTLSELYTRYLERRADDRALIQADYENLGGVAGSLRNRASAEYARLDAASQATMRRVLLRMVSLEGGELARRRVPIAELVYADETENAQVSRVISQLTQARLIVPDNDVEGAPVVEPAHDALVRGWDLLWAWIRDDQDMLVLQQRLTQATVDWARNQRSATYLWDDDPRLPQLEQVHSAPGGWLNKLEREFVAHSSAQRRKNRRNLVAAITSAFVILAMVAAVAIWQRSVAVTNEQRAQTNEQIAETNAQLASTREVEARNAEGQARNAEATAVAERNVAVSRQLAAQAVSLVDERLDLALLLSLEAYGTNDTFEARSSVMNALERTPRLAGFLRGHTDWVRAVAFSPDGTILASGSSDHSIILWDAASRQPLGPPLTGHTGNVESLAFSPDGKTLASGSSDHSIILWDAASRQPLGPPLTGHTGNVESLAFSPDGKTLASGGGDDKTSMLWDVATRQPLATLQAASGYAVKSVAFSPNGSLLASSGGDKAWVTLWDVATRQQVGQPLNGGEGVVTSLAFSPDSRLLASGSTSIIIVWDVNTGEPTVRLNAHTNGVNSVAFSPDGTILASGGTDTTIILWDVASMQPLAPPLRGHTALVWSVAFSPDSKMLASASIDQTVILWNVHATPRLGQPLSENYAAGEIVAFSPDNQKAAVGGDNGVLTLWDVVERRRITPLEGHTATISSIAFSPNGMMLSGDVDGKLILWDVATHQRLEPSFASHASGVRQVAFSPDGKTVASGSSWDSLVIVWDIDTRQPLWQIPSKQGRFVFSPDGKVLAVAGEDGITIDLWDTTQRKRVGQPLVGPRETIWSLAFSPDGTMVAAGNCGAPAPGNTSCRGEIHVWDVATQQLLGPALTKHADNVLNLAFSPDSKTLASGGRDGFVILWDVRTRQPLGLRDVQGMVTSIAFSPNGSMMASASTWSGIVLWDANFESWLTRACQIANRNLTKAEWTQYIGNEEYRKTCPDLPPDKGVLRPTPTASP